MCGQIFYKCSLKNNVTFYGRLFSKKFYITKIQTLFLKLRFKNYDQGAPELDINVLYFHNTIKLYWIFPEPYFETTTSFNGYHEDKYENILFLFLKNTYK